MVSISELGMISQGMRYKTETRVSGRLNRANIEVVRLVPDEEIHLKSDTGLISFEAVYRMSDANSGDTNVICLLDFTFRSFVMHLARPVIESMARDRVRNDMKTLDAILCEEQDVFEPKGWA